MKRVWSAVPAFFGVACIMAAIATAFYLVPQLRVVPLDLDITSDAQTVSPDGASNNRFPAVIFDRCSVSQKKAQQLDASLKQQRRSVIVDPSDSRQATIQSAQSVVIERTRTADGKESVPTVAPANEDRTCTDGLLTATIDRVSVSRKTSVPNGTIASIQLEAVPDGASVKDVSVDAPREGFQYKFGFNVRQRDYLYYDLNTRTDNAARYQGEKVINGVTAYHFVSEVPETDLSNLPNAQGEAALGTMLTMPASWWGISGRDIKPTDPVTLHRYAAATRHVYVEPKTGTIVDGREDQHQWFMSPDQSEDTPASVRNFRFDALKATFQWDDATVTRQTDKAAGYVNKLMWGGVVLPIVLAVVGVLLLALWAFLFFRGRRSDRTDGGGDGGEFPNDPDDGPGPSFAAGVGAPPDDDDRPTTVIPTSGNDGSSGPQGYTTSLTESGRHQRIDDGGGWAPLPTQQPSGPYRADPYRTEPVGGGGRGREPWAREPDQANGQFGDEYSTDYQQTDAYRTDVVQPNNIAPATTDRASDDTTTIAPTEEYTGRHSDPNGTTATTFFGQVTTQSDDDEGGPAVRRHVER